MYCNHLALRGALESVLVLKMMLPHLTEHLSHGMVDGGAGSSVEFDSSREQYCRELQQTPRSIGVIREVLASLVSPIGNTILINSINSLAERIEFVFEESPRRLNRDQYAEAARAALLVRNANDAHVAILTLLADIQNELKSQLTDHSWTLNLGEVGTNER